MNFGSFLAKLALIFSPLFGGGGDLYRHASCPSNTTAGVPFTVLVEGNVGSGKSTLLSAFSNSSLSDDGSVILVPEPVDKWQDVNGTDLLGKVLSGGRRWSGAFQLYSSLTRYRNNLDTSSSSSSVRLMERSVYSERVCFLETMRAAGQISDAEYLIMVKWFRAMTQSPMKERIGPDLVVYIRCDESILWERIRRRGRPEEAGLDPGFISRLQRCHDDWLLHRNLTWTGQKVEEEEESLPLSETPVLVLDGNLPREEFVQMVLRRKDEILGKVLPKHVGEIEH